MGRQGSVGGPPPQGPVPVLAGLMDGNGCSIGTHILSYKPGIEPREGAELRKRASVFQRSSQGAQAPRRSVHAARGRDSLPRHLELTRASAKGSFSFMWTRGKRIPLMSERMECAFRRLPSACMRISVRHLDPARPRHSSRFCATLQTVRSSVRTRGYTQNDTFPMQYDAGSACTIRRGQ